MFKNFTARRQPPLEKLGAASSRIYDGAPARQPELPHASRNDDGGAADQSIFHSSFPP